MRIPESVKIGGITYDVQRPGICSDSSGGTEGLITYAKQLIEVRADLKGEYADLTFLHELVHGIYRHAGWEQDEKAVDTLSTALHMVIKDNPDLFKQEGRK